MSVVMYMGRGVEISTKIALTKTESSCMPK